MSFLGCAGIKPAEPYVPKDDWEETKTLPPHPEDIKLYPKTKKGDWIEPSIVGSCIGANGDIRPELGFPCPPKSGLLVSEERVARDILYRSEYKRLRTFYEADRLVWRAHRALYEERLKLAQERINELRPNWWERNAFQIGIGGGLVLGVSLVAILGAIAR